jgi:spermidine/putrescine transport system permease protein
MLRFSVTPEVNAASTILIVVTIFFTFIGLQMQNRSEQQAKAAA